MKFALTILGSNSAVPAHGRFPTAQVLNVLEQLYLIDCGEGTQMQMQRYQIRRNRIKQIFISHLHGDHIFGLIGLLTSYSLSRRSDPMDIFAPAGLQEIIEVQMKHTGGQIQYPLNFHVIETTTSYKIYEDQAVEVITLPLAHRIPCVGYLFREKARLPNIRAEKIAEYGVPYQSIPQIKAGNDFITENGQRIPHTELLLPAVPPRAYAFCSDTIYLESLIPLIRGVDLLYHETTFLEDRVENAKETMHSTARQAATLALKAEVGQLLTGHYSSRYQDLSPILTEARAVFPNTALGLEGQTYTVALKKP